jgi:hypothetical protein
MRAISAKRLPKTPTEHDKQVSPGANMLTIAVSRPPVPELPSTSTSPLRSEDRRSARSMRPSSTSANSAPR